MECNGNTLCVCVITIFLISGTTATDTSGAHRDDVIEQLLLRVDRLEARAEDQQREISDIRAQLVSHKKRTFFLESIVRRMKKNEKKGTVNHLRSQITLSDTREHEKTDEKRTAHARIRQTEVDAPIAFFVSLSHHQANVGAHQAIIFDHVITNVGNAYNPHLGAFVAPVQGTYAISTSLMTINTISTHYYIAVNGHAVSNMFVHGMVSPYVTSSQTAVLQLAPGDDVTIRSYDAGISAHGDHYSTLSGFLLYQQGSSTGQIVGK